jgi:hypothetical protein
VFELSYRAKNVHLKPRCRVGPRRVDTVSIASRAKGKGYSCPRGVVLTGVDHASFFALLRHTQHPVCLALGPARPRPRAARPFRLGSTIEEANLAANDRKRSRVKSSACPVLLVPPQLVGLQSLKFYELFFPISRFRGPSRRRSSYGP